MLAMIDYVYDHSVRCFNRNHSCCNPWQPNSLALELCGGINKVFKLSDIAKDYTLPQKPTLLLTVDIVQRNLLHNALLSENADSVMLELAGGKDPLELDGRGETALHYVAYFKTNNGYKMAEILLKKKCDLSIRNEFGDNPIHVAARNGNTRILGLFLKYAHHNLKIDAIGSDGLTALHHAIYKDSFECVKSLIKSGAKLDIQSAFGFTPTEFAYSLKRNRILKLLCRNKAPKGRVSDTNMWSPLQLSLEQDLQTVKNNVEKGVEINNWVDTGYTALHYAVFHNNMPLTKYLVQKKALVNATDILNLTPLIIALVKQREEHIFFLLSKGADTNVRGMYNSSCLHIAVENFIKNKFNMRVIKELVSRNKKLLSSVDKDNITPLAICIENEFTEIARFLLENGADPNATIGKRSESLLKYSLNVKNSALVALLIEYGADLEEKDILHNPMTCVVALENLKVCKRLIESGYSYQIPYLNQNSMKIIGTNPKPEVIEYLTLINDLFKAVEVGNAPEVQRLVEAGVFIEAHRDPFRGTPLILASAMGSFSCVEILLKNGANPNQFNGMKDTSLHLAARNGHLSIVEALLKFGANHLLENIERHTPLQVAQLFKHQNISTLLTEVENVLKRKSNSSLLKIITGTVNNDELQLLELFKKL